MQYSVDTQIKKISEVTRKTVDEIIASFGDDIQQIGDEIIAWNRRAEHSVNSRLEKLEKEQVRAEAKKHFHWTKENGEWVVEGSFEGLKEGDEIEVFRVNGTSQTKEIDSFTTKGNAVVK